MVTYANNLLTVAPSSGITIITLLGTWLYVYNARAYACVQTTVHEAIKPSCCVLFNHTPMQYVKVCEFARVSACGCMCGRVCVHRLQCRCACVRACVRACDDVCVMHVSLTLTMCARVILHIHVCIILSSEGS